MSGFLKQRVCSVGSVSLWQFIRVRFNMAPAYADPENWQ